MVSSRAWKIGTLAALVLLAAAESAYAWGPLTHVRFAGDVLSQIWLLPAGVAALLARHAREYIFGNIAADVVLAKKLSRIKQVCHRWNTGFALLEHAETDAGRAFAYGYLSHLAADTVAHNKFLPRQILSCGSTITFGHIYWEIRADAMLPAGYWPQLQSSLRRRYDEPERLLSEHLTMTLLPFGMNRRIFRRINLLASARSWHRSVGFWSKLSRWPLESELVNDYHAESVDRIIDVLEAGRNSAVLFEDPNGNLALSHARIQKRVLRRMRRANLPVAGVIRETVRHQAPRLRSGSNGRSSAASPAGASVSENIVI
jgi:hypothetical protein